ncbi:O-antigen ligase family protein [Sphingobium yanoikuyae]|uniref:O-antigen ligase family protein n=1 Tax=Sphingobium yanoikuyae TaxID=13690 RepID=A0A9X7YFR8_SPHYA|nr:O-antigen ligase family protein [Sphingobium yanoikuyae]QNG48488.1 O-antigen ligase family protein [Sphingobium yanoikuyae]
MRTYLYAVLIFLSGALMRPLSGNANSFVDAGESPVIQYLGTVLYVIALPIAALTMVRGLRQRKRPASIVLIAFVIALWVFLSISWSADPALSARRAAAYAGSLLITITLAFSIPPREVIRAFVFVTLGLLALTTILLVIAPGYAIHQGGEAGVAEHAGRLRGTFGHKNEFARVTAAGVIMLWLFGRQVLRQRTLWLGFLVLAAILLLLAGSAKIIIAFPIAFVAAWMLRLPIAPAYRSLMLLALAVPVLLLYFSGILDMITDSLIVSVGRDPGMSGREEIWAVAWSSIVEHPILGQGYYAGWAAEAKETLERIKWGVSLGHAHNGFLETLLDLGSVGLVLALIPLVYIAICAIGMRRERAPLLQELAGMWVVFDITLNSAGSYLVNYNDLYPTMTLLIGFWFAQVRRGAIDDASLSLLIPSRYYANIPRG